MKKNNELSELLIDIYNRILRIEQMALKRGAVRDLSFTEIHTIEAIGLSPKSMTEMAHELGITTGTITSAMSRLEKKGYIIRHRGEDDRRMVFAELTRSGKAVYHLHRRFHDKMIHEILQELPDEDERVLVRAMARLDEYFTSYMKQMRGANN